MSKSILIILYYYRPYISGLSEYTKNLAENLVVNGYRVTVLTTRFDRSLPVEEVVNGVRVIRVSVFAKLGKGVLSPVLFLETIFMARNYDYVNFHMPLAEAGVSSLFINRDKLIPVYHCDLDLGKGLVLKMIERLSNVLMSLVLRRSKKIIVTSIDYFKHSRFNKYLGKAVGIYPPIDDKKFGPVDFADLQQRLGLSVSTVKIGFVGRIVMEKGLQYLLSAVDILCTELTDFKVLIAGDYLNVAGGSVWQELQHYVGKHPDKIIFTGRLEQEDLNKFYSMIDVLVLPSINPLEAFGMVQVEAMLCGTPVVATNLPGVREVLRKVNFGRLVEPRDAEGLAEKILDVVRGRLVLNDKELDPFRLENVIKEYTKIFS
jgi:glycosyltransferase involved in cell wall biosynthesis